MSGFLTAYTANDLTSVRNGGVIRQFLAVHTPSIQLQFQPDANNTASSAASITYSSPAPTGAYTDVLLGMTVLVTPSSNYASDLLNKPEDCLVTYARIAAEDGTLHIAETSFAWTTGHTVTVLDDYRVFARPVRTENGFTYFDYDQSPAGLKPRITGIQATVLTTSGSNASVAFAPSATSMAGGSITTWAWDVDDGSFTSGSSSSQNVTVQFPIGSRYVHLTVTDSFGYTNYLAVPVWVIPDDYSSTTTNGIEGLRVSRTLGMGASAECNVITGATWLDGSAAVIFSDVKFNNTVGAIHNNIDFVGWIASDSSRTRGDEDGVVRSVRVTLEDLTAQMQRIYVPELGADLIPNTRSGFSIAVLDGVWLILSRLTTASNLASWDFFTAYTGYLTPRLNTVAGDAWQAITILSERCGAIITTSTDGKQRIDLSLFYASTTTRNSATVIATLTTSDATEIDFQRESGNVVDSVEVGCEAYNSSSQAINYFRAISPASAETGAIVEYQDGIVLPVDQTTANNYINAGAYASYFFNTSNFTGELRASLLGEWRDLIPSGYTWHKWTLTSTDLERGLTFDTNTRFLLTDVTLQQDNASGAMSVDATFREEPDSTANYAVMVESVPDDSGEESTYPNGSQNPNIELTSGVYQDNENDGWVDPTDPNGGGNRIKRKGMESFLVPFHSNATVSMTSDTVASRTYYVEVSNWTYVGNSGTWTITYDFLNGIKPEWDIIEMYGFAGAYTYPYSENKWYVPTTNGVADVAQNPPSAYACLFGIVWSRQIARSYTITSATATYTRTSGSIAAAGAGITKLLAPIDDDIAETIEGEFDNYAVQTLTNGVQQTLTGSTTESGIYGVGWNASYSSGDRVPLYLEKLVVSGTGDAPPDAKRTNLTRGDAFYEGWEDGVASAYSGSNGLQVNGSRPTLPGYNGSHVYRFSVTGTGSPLQFQFVDSDYTDNTPNFMRVTVWGPGIE